MLCITVVISQFVRGSRLNVKKKIEKTTELHIRTVEYTVILLRILRIETVGLCISSLVLRLFLQADYSRETELL